MRPTSRARLSRALLAVLAVMLSHSVAVAQSGRGTIRGLVSDTTAAAIPQASVVATEQDTGVATSARSNAEGLYALLNLPAGTYAVTFTVPGFAPLSRKGIRVGVQSAIALDVTLSIGGVNDSVTVEADASPLAARNAEVGTALQNSLVTALPLSITGGRSLENFAYAIVPGVEGDNWSSNIVGGAPFTKEVILDGSSATVQIQGHITESSPPMDAVQEFKVETSGIPAEYGRTGGGLFNFTLRSGTNSYRGTAYGQFRNEALNANTWINNRLAAANPSKAAQYARPRDRQGLGGAAVGGPIAAGRTFFFSAFEEYHQSRAQLGAFDRTVPTPAFLNGDFSALLDTTTRLGVDAAGNPIYKGAILDPRTGLVFPGNVIPASRISPVSRRIADIYRQSYGPMLAGALSNNSAGPAYIDPEFRQHQFSVKVDHNIAAGSRLTGSFITTARPRTLADQGGVWDPGDPTGGPLSKAREQRVTTHQARGAHSQVVSPSLLHEAALTFNRFRNPSTSGSSGGSWPAQLGLDVPGAYGTFPQISYGDVVNGVGESPIGYGISDYYVASTYQYTDSLSWVKGRHVLKFGGDLRFIRMNSRGDRAYLTYNFTPAQTGVQGGPFASQVGFGFASFLLGDVASASMNVPSDLYGRRNYQAVFVQDDVRVTDRLTLNPGLRWETTGAWHEKYGHWANFNTTAINPVTGVPGVVQYTDQEQGSFEGKRDFGEFGPRIGAAYRASDRIVVRAAYGVLYSPIGTNFWQGVPYGFAPGFTGNNAVLPTGSNAPAFNWDQHAYPGALTPPTRNPAYTQWGMVSVSPDSLKAGRIQQWNAGVEYELGNDLTVGANYVGNRGTRLQSGDFQRNQPDPAVMRTLLLAGKEWNWVADPGSAAAAGVPFPYAGFAGPAWMAITPYPQAAAGYGPLLFVGSPLGRSDYHALQLSANKRLSRGVTGSVNYTLSRERGNMDSGFQERWWSGRIQDVTMLDEEASVVGVNDRTHVLKGFVTWSLPVGEGRRFLGNSSGLVDVLAAGWSVSALVRYQSGLPLAITSSNAYAGWSYPIYVNRNPQVSPAAAFNSDQFDPVNAANPANRYFNPAAFSNPPYGSLGTGPGRFADLRGFGASYEDVSILKNIAFGRGALQFKLDVFNLFNRHYLADPVTDMSSPLFGSVITTGSQAPRQLQLGVRYQW